MQSRGSVYLLYHFFHPDDVVSGRLYSDLAEDLTAAGFAVTALPSIRSCHGPNVRLRQRESWAGGEIRRVWRPDWPQHKTWGRFGNTLFMLAGWTWRAAVMPRRRGEVMIVGTDPVLAVLIAITWRLFRPRARIIHWCHDLYPDAALADGMIRDDAAWVRLIHRLLRVAYRRCDVIADLGGCMRRLLQAAEGVHGGNAVAGPARAFEPDRPAFGEGETVAALAGSENFTLPPGGSDAVAAGEGARLPSLPRRSGGEGTMAGPPRALEPDPPAAREGEGGGLPSLPRRSGGEGMMAGPPRALEPDPPAARESEVVTGERAEKWRCGRFVTLVPWSLVEPAALPAADPALRRELFGDARLGLLYSGNFGRAHDYQSMLALARRLRDAPLGFCFAGRGVRLESLREAVTADDTNVRFAGFADEDRLQARLSAADVHLVSLRPSWTGTVVPSKFFGALAMGRPVLFAGSPDSALARWIDEFEIGWLLTPERLDRVAGELQRLAEDLTGQALLRQRCFEVYHQEFSRRVQIGRWLQVIAGEHAGPCCAGKTSHLAPRDVVTNVS